MEWLSDDNLELVGEFLGEPDQLEDGLKLRSVQRGPMCGHGWARVVFFGLITCLVGKATLAEDT